MVSWTPGQALPSEATSSRLEAEHTAVSMMRLRAPATALIGALEALFELYGDSGLPAGDDAAATRFWRAWLEDLHDAPFACVEEAIRRWRQSPARKRPATAGQLMAPVTAEIDALKRHAAKVRAALDQRAQEAAAAAEAAQPTAPDDRATRQAGAALMRDFAAQLRAAPPLPTRRRSSSAGGPR